MVLNKNPALWQLLLKMLILSILKSILVQELNLTGAIESNIDEHK